jgi:hypothetical protein
VSDAPPPRRTLRDTIVGWTIYPAGDLLAQLITGHVQWSRVLVMAVVGGIVYRFEVPRWFRMLDRYEFASADTPFKRALVRDPERDRHLNWLGRTLGAILYFNPLWIIRHMLFIRLGSDPASLLTLHGWSESAIVGAKSFLLNLPLSFGGNYVIQMKMPLRWRFLASSIMSAILACGYALMYRYL